MCVIHCLNSQFVCLSETLVVREPRIHSGSPPDGAAWLCREDSRYKSLTAFNTLNEKMYFMHLK